MIRYRLDETDEKLPEQSETYVDIKIPTWWIKHETPYGYHIEETRVVYRTMFGIELHCEEICSDKRGSGRIIFWVGEKPVDIIRQYNSE
jgi:hypothetical protein